MLPELFEDDEHGHLVVDGKGEYVSGALSAASCRHYRTFTRCATAQR
jgi:hypothetical protein